MFQNQWMGAITWYIFPCANFKDGNDRGQKTMGAKETFFWMDDFFNG